MKHLILILVTFCALTSFAQTPEEAAALHNKGRKALTERKIEEGRELTRQAMEARQKLFGKVSVPYIDSRNNYAMSFMMAGDYAQAAALQHEVMALCEQLSTPHPRLLDYSYNMGLFAFQNSDHPTAINYLERVLPDLKPLPEQYEQALTLLGLMYLEKNDTANQLRILNLTQELYENLPDDSNDSQVVIRKAQYYAQSGNQAKAKELFLRLFTMECSKKDRLEQYTLYAQFLEQINDYKTATEYNLMAADIAAALYGQSSSQCLTPIKTAALNSMLDKDYERMIACHEILLELYPESDIESAISSYQLMSTAYQALKQYDKAKEYIEPVVEYYAQKAPESEPYAKALYQNGSIEKNQKDYNAAIENYTKAKDLFEKLGLMTEYANASSSLKMCLAFAHKPDEVEVDKVRIKAEQTKKLDEIIAYETENLDLTRDFLGELNYAQSLADIGGCYALKQDFVHSISAYENYITAIRRALRETFRLQHSEERTATWEDEIDNINALNELLITVPDEDLATRTKLGGIAYDAALLSKGILLHSSIEFEKILNRENDPHLNEIYQEIKDNDIKIKLLRAEAHSDETLKQLTKMGERNRMLQLELYKQCAAIADFTDYLDYDWHDVQTTLRKGDVAIEFREIDYGALAFDQYEVALVLTPDSPAPKIVMMATLEELHQLNNDPEAFTRTDNPFWGKLSESLKDAQRIFFAADGELNKMGIEYLAYNGHSLFDQYEVYRLSSTKELCRKHTPIAVNRVALFGDINYNDLGARSSSTDSSVRSVGGNILWANLEHTRREVNGIDELLHREAQLHIEKYTNQAANVQSFLALDQSRVNLIHIATHGATAKQQASEAESMENSLLVFAGANTDSRNVITAAQIAEMQLDQCDLAVLSACETGLGKLGNDGVYGLQRGFKNAGVRTILMSLKPVYDSVTADFMLYFYTHLMQGASKRGAFAKAQAQLKADGHTDPKYWTSFILLDAF